MKLRKSDNVHDCAKAISRYVRKHYTMCRYGYDESFQAYLDAHAVEILGRYKPCHGGRLVFRELSVRWRYGEKRGLSFLYLKYNGEWQFTERGRGLADLHLVIDELNKTHN